MNLTFWSLAALMLLVAMAAVLLPLLRAARGANADANSAKLRALQAAHDVGVLTAEEFAAKRATLATESQSVGVVAGSRRTAMIVVISVILLMPAAAIALYYWKGDPRALDPAALLALNAPKEATAQDMNQAITSLAARLEKEPDDLQGWLLLGRAYKSTERFAEAASALRHALDLVPDNVDAMVEYAEAAALASAARRIEGEPRALLEKAVAANPQHQRALWLLGIADLQAGNPDAAVVWWRKLLPMLEPGSEIALSVQSQIDEALAAGSGATESDAARAAATAAPTAPAAPTGATAQVVGPQLTVQVALADTLRDKVDPSDTLYIFARAAEGPRMPLAIQRRSARELPLTLTLDDSMGMTPALKLSSATEIVVGARISKSGNATPQSGDLQVLSNPLPVGQKEPIVLTIAEIVP